MAHHRRWGISPRPETKPTIVYHNGRICQAGWLPPPLFGGRRPPGPRTFRRRPSAPGGSGLARHWFHGRFQASALPLVELWVVLRSAGLPRGPAAWASRGPLPLTLAALRERKACAPRNLGFRRRFPTPYPGGKRQPRFRREQRAGWGGVAPAGSQFAPLRYAN